MRRLLFTGLVTIIAVALVLVCYAVALAHDVPDLYAPVDISVYPDGGIITFSFEDTGADSYKLKIYPLDERSQWREEYEDWEICSGGVCEVDVDNSQVQWLSSCGYDWRVKAYYGTEYEITDYANFGVVYP